MIAILGAHGRLGMQLVSQGGTPLLMDITKPFDIPEGTKAVINCAAYTNVDGAESKDGYERALAVNYLGVKNVYAACQRSNTLLIHISTDYIFAGKHGPYLETSQYPKEDDLPVSNYGLSKLGGEAILLGQPGAYIVRTTGLYGGVSGRSDFFRAVVQTLSRGDEFGSTKTLIGNQTYIPHLAEALLVMAERVCVKPSSIPNILHIASKSICSRFDFARMIAEKMNFPVSKVIPVLNSKIPGWIAKRPYRGGLLTTTASGLGIPIYSISEGLDSAVEHWHRNSSV